MNSSEPLNKIRIEKSLLRERKVVVFNRTASTNDVAWEYAKGKASDGLVVLAEEQTKGRGRRNNSWQSVGGASILCSFVQKKTFLEPELLTLTIAVAISDAVGKCCGVFPRIKWPNDLFLNGKKIGGILLESRINNGCRDCVVGFGINCNQDQVFFKKHHLSKIATSIFLESDRFIDRDTLVAEILNSVDDCLQLAQKDPDSVILKWRQKSLLLGHRVTVEYNRKQFSGQCVNIDPVNGLVLQLDRGGVRMFDAAHSTIVKD